MNRHVLGYFGIATIAIFDYQRVETCWDKTMNMW